MNGKDWFIETILSFHRTHFQPISQIQMKIINAMKLLKLKRLNP